MRPWTTRPREEANLLNPPFCSLLLTLATEHYERTAKVNMPYVYAFLVLPIVLHTTPSRMYWALLWQRA